MSIIIVDDNVEICTLITEILVAEGLKVRPCTNPTIIFEMINEQKPKLVITDMLMSGIDGRNIVKTLKSNKETENIRILMMSAHPNSRKISLEVGADAHISKPFEIDEFTSQVKDMLK